MGSVVKPSKEYFQKSFFLLGNSLLGSLVFTRYLLFFTRFQKRVKKGPPL